MSKTKEISGWVQTVAIQAFENKDFNDVPFFREPPAHRSSAYQEAKLVIKSPERKVEITESDFDNIANLSRTYARGGGIKTWAETMTDLKQKLFGNGEQ